MINEMVDVQKYLAGEGLNRDIEYRICLLLAKWFYQNGATTREEIRERLKDWAKENDFFITVAMNPLIDKVVENDMKLKGDAPVLISDREVNIIVDKFDLYEERVVALAVLCYAKEYSDNNGVFKLSTSALARWLCMEQRTIRKHIKTLCEFGFIKQKRATSTSSWYRTTVVSKLNEYQLCFDFDEDGEYQLIHNNLNNLYDDIFISGEWHDIPGHKNYKISDDGHVRVLERFVGDKRYPSKLLKPTISASGKKYVYLREDDGGQTKIALDKLYSMALTT